MRLVNNMIRMIIRMSPIWTGLSWFSLTWFEIYALVFKMHAETHRFRPILGSVIGETTLFEKPSSKICKHLLNLCSFHQNLTSFCSRFAQLTSPLFEFGIFFCVDFSILNVHHKKTFVFTFTYKKYCMQKYGEKNETKEKKFTQKNDNIKVITITKYTLQWTIYLSLSAKRMSTSFLSLVFTSYFIWFSLQLLSLLYLYLT